VKARTCGFLHFSWRLPALLEVNRMKIRQLACFQHVKWDPDRHELRRFARSMLVGFALIGLVRVLFRHHIEMSTLVLWSLGLVLAVGAMLSRLGRVTYLAVYLPTSLIGYGVSQTILTLLFFLVFAPLGLVLRLLGKDLLGLEGRGLRSNWTSHPAVRDAESYYRQF
jgi:hypothetical protein